MSEEKKYYVPEIEEFRVGFEYQWRRKGDDGDWTDAIVVDGRQIDDIHNPIYELRVKHLDRDDIEAEGWKVEKEGYTLTCYRYWYGENKSGVELQINNERIASTVSTLISFSLLI